MPLLLLLLLLSACGPIETQSSEYAQARAVVRLLSAYDGNASGVVIGKGRILTAAHVAEHDGLTLKPGDKPLTVVRIDQELDVAIVQADVDCPCAELASSSPIIDEKVIVIGYPLYGALKSQVLTRGESQGMIDGRLLLSAPVAMGNSGGGVFVNRANAWQLVGILIQVPTQRGQGPVPVLVPANYLSVAVGTETIREFVGSS